MKALTRSLIVIFVATGLALTTFAGPEPIRDFKESKEVAPMPPPPCTWTGFYLGINAGYSWSNDDSVDTETVNVFSESGLNGDIGGEVAALATGDVPVGNNSGFIGGGQIGFNYQIGRHFVVGLETDFQGMTGDDGSGSLEQAGFVPGSVGGGGPGGEVSASSVITSSRSIDFLGTARGRLGVLVTPCLLVYGTGGFAYGDISSHTEIVEQLGFSDTPFPFGTSGHLNDNDMRVGWTGGGGLEWLFCRHWSIKVEYLFYDLGSDTYDLDPLQQFGNKAAALSAKSASRSATRVNGPVGPELETIGASRSTATFDGNIVRAGLNFHF